jgi:exopolysaccharide biosynthesis polyprenyl glycosylphosphotransferase
MELPAERFSTMTHSPLSDDERLDDRPHRVPIRSERIRPLEPVPASSVGGPARRSAGYWLRRPGGVPADPGLRRVTPTWLRRYIGFLVCLDLIVASLSALAAYLVRFGGEAVRYDAAVALLFPVVVVASAHVARAYEPRFVDSGSDGYRRYFDACVRVGALVGVTSYGFKLEVARGFVVLAFPAATAGGLLARHVARGRLHALRRSGRCQHRVLVVGRERSIAELVRRLHSRGEAGYAVVGACVDNSRGPQVEGVPVVGTTADVVAALKECRADTLAVTAWSDLSQEELRQLSWQLEGLGLAILVEPRLTDIAGPRIHVRPVADLPLLHVEEPEFGGGRRMLKSAVDRSTAAVALMIMLPVVIAISTAIRVTSPGPALFHQTRIGLRGRSFTMYKFRTMRKGADREVRHLAALNENADGLLFKIREDPRVTSVGRWLRRFSLDELPQLINVVKGDMSLVGPRPPLATEVAQYADRVQRRLLVKPGMTGLWQISGRSDLPWDESVRLDLYYVENWSPAFDLSILWKTFFAVVSRRGAY